MLADGIRAHDLDIVALIEFVPSTAAPRSCNRFEMVASSTRPAHSETGLFLTGDVRKNGL
jgi:hypothetical protein